MILFLTADILAPTLMHLVMIPKAFLLMSRHGSMVQIGCHSMLFNNLLALFNPSSRYGPPAPYQIPCLPPGFQSHTPPEYYGMPNPPYVSPPARFDHGIFVAIAMSKQAMIRKGKPKIS